MAINVEGNPYCAGYAAMTPRDPAAIVGNEKDQMVSRVHENNTLRPHQSFGNNRRERRARIPIRGQPHNPNYHHRIEEKVQHSDRRP
jgi:hypothetical protein